MEILYPSIFICLVTLITLPVSTAAASPERSFGVMQSVKTYLRSSMASERLSGHALLHTYKDFKFDLDDLVTKI